MDRERIKSLWAGEHWPPKIRGYLFLPEAFNRIGRMLFGDEWQDDWASYDLLPTPPESAASASRTLRFEAHEYLDGLAGDANEIGYEDDYEHDPEPSSPQAALQILGNPYPPPPPPVDTSRRAPGFHFSEKHWLLFRAKFTKPNEEIQRIIDKVGVATQWLFDETFAGGIVPFIMHASEGGKSAFTTRDDWLMPLVERRRQRIQTCRLVPGHPAWPDGSHWIFINADELQKAMEAYCSPIETISLSGPSKAAPETPAEAVPAAVARKPRETKSGNVDAALRANFGENYADGPRPGWNLILDRLVEWSKKKENKDRKFPAEEESRRREVYRLWPDRV